MSGAMKRGSDHIFIIGFLGTGKSTLARNLGKLFNRRYVDTDRLVERRAGASGARIFPTQGEQQFRVLETRALPSLEKERSLLVSCGGGIVETPENLDLLRAMGFTVYLEGDLADSIRQIRTLRARPDFKSPQHAARLLEHRRPLYEQVADLTIDIRGRSFKQVSYECAERLLERGLL